MPTRTAASELAHGFHDPDELVPLASSCGIEKAEACPEPRTAFARALSERRESEGIVLTGSVYLAGQIRPGLR